MAQCLLNIIKIFRLVLINLLLDLVTIYVDDVVVVNKYLNGEKFTTLFVNVSAS